MSVREILLSLKMWVMSWFAKRERHDEQSNGVYEQGDMSDDWREEEWW